MGLKFTGLDGPQFSELKLYFEFGFLTYQHLEYTRKKVFD